jgi:excisionase family DNA binding protein
MKEKPILLDKRNAATTLSISIRTLEILIRRGELRAVRIGRRCLVSYEELERFVRTGVSLHVDGEGR